MSLPILKSGAQSRKASVSSGSEFQKVLIKSDFDHDGRISTPMCHGDCRAGNPDHELEDYLHQFYGLPSKKLLIKKVKHDFGISLSWEEAAKVSDIYRRNSGSFKITELIKLIIEKVHPSDPKYITYADVMRNVKT